MPASAECCSRERDANASVAGAAGRRRLGYAFQDRAELLTARDQWMDDKPAALAVSAPQPHPRAHSARAMMPPTRTRTRPGGDRRRTRRPPAQTYGEIGTWDVSRVSDFSYLFCGRADSWGQSQGCRGAMQNFNDDIGDWDVSAATTMRCEPWA